MECLTYAHVKALQELEQVDEEAADAYFRRQEEFARRHLKGRYSPEAAPSPSADPMQHISDMMQRQNDEVLERLGTNQAGLMAKIPATVRGEMAPMNATLMQVQQAQSASDKRIEALEAAITTLQEASASTSVRRQAAGASPGTAAASSRAAGPSTAAPPTIPQHDPWFQYAARQWRTVPTAALAAAAVAAPIQHQGPLQAVVRYSMPLPRRDATVPFHLRRERFLGNLGRDTDNETFTQRAREVLAKADVPTHNIETITPAYSDGSGSTVDVLFKEAGVLTAAKDSIRKLAIIFM
jgi:hypothetical protein